MSKTIIKRGIAFLVAFFIIGCNIIIVVESIQMPSTMEITGFETESQKLESLPVAEVNLEIPSTESDENFIVVKENPISQALKLDSLKQELEKSVQIIQEEKIKQEKENIVAYADQFVGYPYVWGGNSLTHGCDCSHFVWLVLRDTIGYSGGYSVSAGWRTRGASVPSLVEAEAGDVICYSGHVAIYDGEGGIVEALNPRKGIVHFRQANCTTILAIRRFI